MRHGKDGSYVIDVDRDMQGRVIKEVIIVQPPNAEAQIQDVAANLNNLIEQTERLRKSERENK